MTIIAPPRLWASDTNFASGPDIGTPTKVDPGTGLSAQGAIPETGLPAQHYNHVLNAITAHQRSAIDDPEIYARIRDDFMPGAYDATAELLHTDLTWRVTENGAATQGPVTTFANNPGVHFATIPANQSYEMHLGEELVAGLVPWGKVEQVTLVFSLFSSNFTGAEAFVGLATQLSDTGPGTDAVGLWFDKPTSNNWLIRHKVGGVDDATDTTVAMVNNEFVAMKVRRISATQVTVHFNGTLAATLTDSTTAPADATGLNVGVYANAGGSASLTIQWDLVDVMWATPDRAT